MPMQSLKQVNTRAAGFDATVVEETLSDKSKVYAVLYQERDQSAGFAKGIRFNCLGRGSAYDLADILNGYCNGYEVL